ncbi:MAG TPA: hypothetical protein DCE41_22250, partial [Cytophagales bacterium]|nr:hypothetical protein [Cytophagales bacterium]
GIALLQTRNVTDEESNPPTTTPLIAWDEPFRVSFYARVTQPRFWAATELPSRNVRKQLFYYTNADVTADDGGTKLNATLVDAARLPMPYRIVSTQTQEIAQLTAQLQLFPKGKESAPPLWKGRWKINGLTEREDGGTVYDHQFEGELPALDIEPGLYTLRQTVLGSETDRTLFLDADLPNPMPLAVVLLQHNPGESPELNADESPEFQLRFANRKLAWRYRVQLPSDWNPGVFLTIVDKKVENPNPQSPYPTAYFKTNPELANYAPGNVIELTSVDNDNNPLLLPMLDVPNADLKLYSVGPPPGNIPVLPGDNEVGQPAGNDMQLGNSNPGNGASLGSSGNEEELFQVPNPSLSQPDPVMYLSLK